VTYSTTAELVSLTGSPLSSAILQAIIDQADRDIVSQLRLANISAPGSDDDLKAASLKLSIAGVVRRGQLDGSKPVSSIRIGDISTSEDPDEAIRQLTESAGKNIEAYIMSHGTQRRDRWYLRKVNG